MEEGDFGRQRRNLLVLSTMVIAFNLAGGDISKLSFQGMEFHNQGGIAVMVWLAFCYVFWRYHVYSAQERNNFAEAFTNYVWGMERCQTLAKELCAEDPKWNPATGFSRTSPLNQLLTIRFRYAYTDSSGAQVDSREKEFRADFVAALLIANFLRFAIRQPHVSDTVFPYAIALMAGLVAFTRWCYF